MVSRPARHGQVSQARKVIILFYKILEPDLCSTGTVPATLCSVLMGPRIRMDWFMFELLDPVRYFVYEL